MSGNFLEKVYWDAGAIAGQGGQQKRKDTEDHIQQIFIILFPNHVLLLFLGPGFVLIRGKAIKCISIDFKHKVPSVVFSG